MLVNEGNQRLVKHNIQSARSHAGDDNDAPEIYYSMVTSMEVMLEDVQL